MSLAAGVPQMKRSVAGGGTGGACVCDRISQSLASHFRPGDRQAPASAEKERGEGPPDPPEPAGARADGVARGARAGGRGGLEKPDPVPALGSRGFGS